MPVVDESTITLQDIDPALSLLAASYKLIKANPNRFCQQQPSNLDEYTWDIHHEDWMRAHAVITYTRARQSFLADFFQINAGQFPARIRTSVEQERPEFYGYVTDELLEKASSGHNKTTAVEFIQEMSTIDPDSDAAEVYKLSQLATHDEIFRVLNTTKFFRTKTVAERDRIIQDTHGALSEAITEAVCTTLSTIAPGIDLDEALNSLNIPIKMQRSRINNNERKVLQTLLRPQVRRAQFEVFKPATPSLQDHPDGDDVIGDNINDGEILSNGIVNHELGELRKARAQIGENLPPNQDLINICRLRGIDVNTLAVNPYNPLTIARAPQIPGIPLHLLP
jgi:hypothetical protein